MDDAKDQIVDVRSMVEAISTDDSDFPLYQVESLCMRYGQNGITRFCYLPLIVHIKGERNNEVQFAGEIQPKGCCYCLEVPAGDLKILNEQVVKSESATIKIPKLDFEIPPEAQRGSLSTKVDPQTAEAIDQFLLKLKACAIGVSPFTFIQDDPVGNSFIENLFAPSHDPSLSIRIYEHTPEQEAHGSVGAAAGHRAIAQSNSAEMAEALFQYISPEEVMTFPSTCGDCAARCET
ncbi:Zinc finger, ZPR1-type [Trema orientale]|uniref:Zinc finger, ZPR1-type n=1 Tax=Trema orientale TaxID=63057 RepID=A0A2P5DME9_TREOI|nr:Zinc finger, ZPR1-type [Trema orientale]